jgi:hypothetical protein
MQTYRDRRNAAWRGAPGLCAERQKKVKAGQALAGRFLVFLVEHGETLQRIIEARSQLRAINGLSAVRHPELDHGCHDIRMTE